ncbi:MAG: lytic transglycosylase domain-containing protein, partial [Pseudomonadota bacterium]
GWIALRFLRDPERAKAHFTFLGTGVNSPISLSRGEYWLGRAWAAGGDPERASYHYRVAAEYPYAYYGQLALHELGSSAPKAQFPDPLQADEMALEVFNARPMVHAMHILSELGEDRHFDRFARALDDQLESPGEVVAYDRLVQSERKPYLAVRASKVARNKGADVPSVVYPLYPVPDQAKGFVEEALILGLSRQESEFNPRAFSRAKARGLMQLLASTAKITARKEGFPYSTPRLMDDPAYNLVLGAAHLSHLLERFDGSYIMVLAAYNAGPHRVDGWIKTYGDPRDKDVDPIDWVELIPFSETRNYVMRVLENTQVYRSRLTGVPLGQGLAADIARGTDDGFAKGQFPPAPALWQVALTTPSAAPSVQPHEFLPLAVTKYPELKLNILPEEMAAPQNAE